MYRLTEQSAEEFVQLYAKLDPAAKPNKSLYLLRRHHGIPSFNAPSNAAAGEPHRSL
jgi:hypothetical protein